MKKSLVVYFSHSGNTAYVANEIKKQTGSDIVELVACKAYPKEYKTCTEVALKEKRDRARPHIKYEIEVSSYDTIYLGYPNWWSSAPMIVFSFLEKYQLQGNVIKPFVTHGGGGVANCVSDIVQVLPMCNVEEALVIYDKDIEKCEELVEKWI